MLVNHWTYFIFLVHLFNISASDCIFCLVCHVSLFWLEEIGFWWGRGVFGIENGWGKLEGHILVSVAHRQKELVSRMEMPKHNRIPVSQSFHPPLPLQITKEKQLLESSLFPPALTAWRWKGEEGNAQEIWLFCPASHSGTFLYCPDLDGSTRSMSHYCVFLQEWSRKLLT